MAVGEDLDGGGGACGEGSGARKAWTSTVGVRVVWTSMVEAVGVAPALRRLVRCRGGRGEERSVRCRHGGGRRGIKAHMEQERSVR
jgi:hypothetical protein